MSDGRSTSADPESCGPALSNSQTNEIPTASGKQRDGGFSEPRKKEVVVKIYNKKLLRVKCGAMLAAGLHSLNQFLGLCALTWATVVILGGYVSELRELDFYFVSALLLLEAIRLTAAVFFGNIVTRKLVYRSPDITKITYEDGKRKTLVEVLRNIQYAFQLTVIAISVVLPLQRLEDLGTSKGKSFDGLHDSLFVFYVLVLMNSIIATVAVVHTKTITLLYVTSYDLRRYYDYIVWRAMDNGLLHAQDFDFLTFAMKIQADEYRRNLRAPVVYSLYRDLIEFLYYDKKGFEVVCVSLEAGDPYEREAAANIVGLWTKLDKDRSKHLLGRLVLRLQTRLISRLAEAVGNDETGRAATTSFEKLAEIDPEGLLDVKTQSGERLVDILINRIKGVVEVGKHDKALVYTKALTPLLADDGCRRKIDVEQRRVLAEKLKEVFTSNCLKRMKAVAGNALILLVQYEGELSNDDRTKYKLREDDVTNNLLSPMPKHDEFILEDEKELLLKLIEKQGLPSAWSPPPPRPRKFCPIRRSGDPSICAPLLRLAGADNLPSEAAQSLTAVRPVFETAEEAFFERPLMSFIAAVITLLAIFCAAFFILQIYSF